jgi:formylglycine-generating enzyme required for sulfatase activity
MRSAKILIVFRLALLVLLAAPLVADAGPRHEEALAQCTNELATLRAAIEDLSGHGDVPYDFSAKARVRLSGLEQRANSLPAVPRKQLEPDVESLARDLDALKFDALVAHNPAIDFEKVLLIRRAEGEKLGLPQNWQGDPSLPQHSSNEIATLSIRQRNAAITTLYRPDRPVFVGDLDLHFDANRLLFTTVTTNHRWQVFEMNADASGIHQISPSRGDDVDNYDGIYLPDGRFAYCSTANYQGVPCVGGSDPVGNIHLLSADLQTERRITFDQDHDWCPTLMNDGRIMFLRWEYADLPHYFSRILMSMNPDGVEQAELYGSGSYWPNGIFFARPIPGSHTKFIGIVSGHHGAARMGELIVFDVSKGRADANGAVQRIASKDPTVEPVIQDGLVQGSWPKFLHPFPINDKFFLVAAKPTQHSAWGIYLADIFNNLVLIKEELGSVLFEPIPLRKTPPPPSVPDKVRLASSNAVVAIQDIYTGRGLPGVPRGTVKSLRVYQYEFGYRHLGGHYVVGLEGPWDIRRILGTVPVHEDGSANFEIPANKPVAVQPLDAEGKALQQFRSWFVGMPGERVSCVGCHEVQNAGIAAQRTKAIDLPPDQIAPWHGPARGFDFVREVQPVLDRYCAGCHDGTTGDKKAEPNLADTTIIRTSGSLNRYPKSYVGLHPFVRRNGCEGVFETLTPLEFHADTSELVQILRKGHYNVKLDAEAWSRLVTWIDLNVPAYGTWSEAGNVRQGYADRRRELKKCLANVDENIEDAPTNAIARPAFVAPEPMPAKPKPVAVEGWPFSENDAKQKQAALGETKKEIDLGDGQKISLVRIPAGQFEMGDVNGCADEVPTAKVAIEKPFWLGATEISLAQFKQFDPLHRNGFYDQHNKDQNTPGYNMDVNSNFPAIRVSWDEAMAFCAWLSKRSGLRVTLPDEAQWEWACRAGTASPLNFGTLDTDFGKSANLADRMLRHLAVGGVSPKPMDDPDPFFDFVPKDARFDDGSVHLANVARYTPNTWGLHDMHGNAAEWTRSNYRAYPFSTAAGLDDEKSTGKKVVRGGSWSDRPKSARSAYRLAYPNWQKVYNVGFRILVEDR